MEPFRFDSLTYDGGTPYKDGDPLPGPIEYRRNHLPDNWSRQNIVQGNLTLDLTKTLRLRFLGSHQYEKRAAEGNNFYSSLYNYFNLDRNAEMSTQSTLLSLSVSHHLGEKIFYEAGLNYSDRFSKTVDPYFGDDWKSYPDSMQNAELGFDWSIQPAYLFSLPLKIINNLLF